MVDFKVHLESIAENLPVSMGVSAITYVFTSSLGIHLEMFLIFAILVCLDILTRWLACSSRLWKALYPQSSSTLYDCFLLMWQSRRWRFFDSTRMRKGFKSKMLTYLLLMLASGVTDWMVSTYGGRGYTLLITVYILTATELISCMENLEETGCVSVASELKKLFKARKDKVS